MLRLLLGSSTSREWPERKGRGKGMGKALLSWCGSDLDILLGLLYDREAELNI